MPRPLTTRSNNADVPPETLKRVSMGHAETINRQKLAADVNAASQTLTSLVKKGWKASTAEQRQSSGGKSATRTRGAGLDAPHTVADASKMVTACRRNLSALRSANVALLDIERSAASVLGKLVSLELVRARSSVTTRD